MEDYISFKMFKKLEDTYLKTLYKECKKKSFNLNGINLSDLKKELNLSNSELDTIINYLLRKKLIELSTFQTVFVTDLGIDKLEIEMAQTYEEKEFLVLQKLVECGVMKSIRTNDLASALSISMEELYIILHDFSGKGWVGVTMNNTTQLYPEGYTAFHKWKSTYSNQSANNIYLTNNYGDSNNIIGGQNNIMEIDNLTRNRYKVLEVIYRLSNANPVGIVGIHEIEKNTQIPTHEMSGILVYLEHKNLIEFHGGDVVRIKSMGIDEIEQAKHHPEERTTNFPANITNNVTNNFSGNVGNLQQFTNNSSQSFSQIHAPSSVPDDLAGQITLLREELKKASRKEEDAGNDTSDYDEKIGLVTSAKKAIEAGDESKAKGFLKNGGKWLLDFGTKIGTSIVTEIIKDQAGL